MRGAVTGEDSVAEGDVALMSRFFQPVNQRLDDAASNRFGPTSVFAAVQKDVAESVPDLGAQDVEMVAVGNHRAAVRESPIHGSSDPGRDRLHAAAEPIAVASFDDQVNVVALDGVVSEARSRDRGSGMRHHCASGGECVASSRPSCQRRAGVLPIWTGTAR